MALRAKSTLDTPFSSRTSAVEAHFHLGIVFGLSEDASIIQSTCLCRYFDPTLDPVTLLTSYSIDSNTNVIQRVRAG